MKKNTLIQIVALFLVSLTNLFAQNDIVDNIGDINMMVYENKSKIDKCLLKYLKLQLSTKFDIVNPNQKYNATDVIFYPNKPSRSLIFTGFNEEQNMGFIFYKSGFIGKPYLCLLYKKNDTKEYKVTLLGLSPNVKDFSMLQKEIREKKYSIMSKGSI